MFLNETNILETLEFAGKFKYKNNIKRIKAVQDLDLNVRTIVKIVGVVKFLPTIFSYYSEGVFISQHVKVCLSKWFNDCVDILKSSQGYSKKLDGQLILEDVFHSLDNQESIVYVCDKLDDLITKQCERFKDMIAQGVSESINDAMCLKLTNYLQTHGYNDNNKEIQTYVDVYQFCRKVLLKNRLGQNMRSSMLVRLQYNKIADVINKEESIRLNNPSMFKFILDFGSYNCAELKEEKLKAYVHELLIMKIKSNHYKVEPAAAARLREKIREFKNSLL